MRAARRCGDGGLEPSLLEQLVLLIDLHEKKSDHVLIGLQEKKVTKVVVISARHFTHHFRDKS
jgi:hypothetical protein